MVCYLRKIGHFWGNPARWKCSQKGESLFSRITRNHWFCRTKWSNKRVNAWSMMWLVALREFLTTKKREVLQRIVYHEEPRRCTKPCGGLFTTKSYEDARSLAADCLPRRATKMHKAMRRIVFHEEPRWCTKPCGRFVYHIESQRGTKPFGGLFIVKQKWFGKTWSIIYETSHLLSSSQSQAVGHPVRGEIW